VDHGALFGAHQVDEPERLEVADHGEDGGGAARFGGWDRGRGAGGGDGEEEGEGPAHGVNGARFGRGDKGGGGARIVSWYPDRRVRRILPTRAPGG
jgi:hypothetical protein